MCSRAFPMMHSIKFPQLRGIGGSGAFRRDFDVVGNAKISRGALVFVVLDAIRASKILC